MLNFNNNKTGYTPKFLRQRKFLLIMPLAVIPLVTFLFWSMGLVGSSKTDGGVSSKTNGLNTSLPQAGNWVDSAWSKLNYYEAADKEAAKRAALAKSDPYYQLAPMEVVEPADTGLMPVSIKKGDASSGRSLVEGSMADHNEAKVYQKIEALNKALADQQPGSAKKSTAVDLPLRAEMAGNDNDISRLESMMQQLNTTSGSSNPEMDQINSMLEKVLDIQHPERVKDRTKEISVAHKEQVFPVEAMANELAVTTLGMRHGDSLPHSTTPVSRIQFYSLEEEGSRVGDNAVHNSIQAMIPETQVLVSGATVKLQLAEEVYISGALIPKGQTIYGEAMLSNERLKIDIRSVLSGKSILPVKLSVYDLDGVEGIYMPGAIGREVAKQSTDQAVQSMGLSSLDATLGAQAASAGIQAAKSFIGKKVKQVRVSVRAGYSVLLYDQSSKH